MFPGENIRFECAKSFGVSVTFTHGDNFEKSLRGMRVLASGNDAKYKGISSLNGLSVLKHLNRLQFALTISNLQSHGVSIQKIVGISWPINETEY